jgi:hypothetical protein
MYGALEAGAQQSDAQLDGQREREQRAEHAEHPSARQLLATPHVGDHEHVQNHHRTGVDDHLCGGDELGAQQQEQGGERDQVEGERKHAVERIAQQNHTDRARDRADRRDEEEDGGHSPSRRSGVRSIASASSISLVKIRSERV